jgi:putative ABC transport system permease protein
LNNAMRARLDDFFRDLGFAVRSLRRSPGFTVVTVASLALGLALAASTLAVVNAYLIRAMPYPAAERLHRVQYGRQEPRGLEKLDWKTLNDVVEIPDASTSARLTLWHGTEQQDVYGLLVDAGSLEMLGVRALLGPGFASEDFRPGAPRVALIGHAVWRDRFGSDPAIVGKAIRVTRSESGEPPEPWRIVGVLPPGFRHVREYARSTIEVVSPQTTPGTRVYLARLRPGVPAAFAQQRIDAAVRAAATSLPPNWPGVTLANLQEEYGRSLRPVLFAILTAAALVIVIVVANVAVLMLLRALRRQKEVAVRIALGAERRHIARMLLTETGLICAAALALGLALTAATLRGLAPLIESRLGKPVPGGTAAIHVDPTVLALSAATGLAIALSLAFIPLLAPWQRRLAETLRREGRSGTDRPALRRVRAALVTLEIALSLALLVGGGLMVRTVSNLVRTDLGIATTHLLRVRIPLPVRGYPDDAAIARYHERLRERLAPVADGPFTFSSFLPFWEPPPQVMETEAGAAPRRASVHRATEDYFATLGIALRSGRLFTASDRLGAEPVALVSESLARELWPDGRALGQRIRSADPEAATAAPTVWRTIVGVVRDVRQAPADENRRDLYVPFAQVPTRYAALLLRTQRPAAFWQETLKTIGAELDPEVSIRVSSTFTEETERQLAGPRFLRSLLAGFATFAAALAFLGIYGVTAYAVQQREKEIVIRVALGATKADVVRLFLRTGGAILAVGIALGLAGAIGVGRVLQHQIFGVAAFDPWTLGLAGGAMAVAGLLATWWPVRRAAIGNLADVLKAE